MPLSSRVNFRAQDTIYTGGTLGGMESTYSDSEPTLKCTVLPKVQQHLTEHSLVLRSAILEDVGLYHNFPEENSLGGHHSPHTPSLIESVPRQGHVRWGRRRMNRNSDLK